MRAKLTLCRQDKAGALAEERRIRRLARLAYLADKPRCEGCARVLGRCHRCCQECGSEGASRYTYYDGMDAGMYCGVHAGEAGFCRWCGNFCAGIESFSPIPGVCDNCRDSYEREFGADDDEDYDGDDWDNDEDDDHWDDQDDPNDDDVLIDLDEEPWEDDRPQPHRPTEQQNSAEEEADDLPF